MADLPPGFVLDAGKPSGLPEGFVLDEKPKAKAQGRSDAIANAFGQGATFNFGDELTAAVRSALPGLSNFMMSGPSLQRDPSIGGSPTPQTVSSAPTYDQRYDENLSNVRAQTAADAKAYPNLTEGANIAGNIAGGVALTPALPEALTTMGPSLLANAGKTAVVGAGMGGAAGFGAGEGGLGNRLASSVAPAVVGGLFGGAMPFVGAGANYVARSPVGRFFARNVVDPVTQAFSGDAGPIAGSTAESTVQQGVIDRLVNASQRGRFDPAQGRAALTELGDQAMLADINPQLRSVAETAYSLPGQTYTHAENVLPARARGAPDRMVGALETGGAPPEAADLAAAFKANTQNVGRTAYGAANDAGLTQSPELRAMLDNPTISAAIKQVLDTDAAARIGRPNAPPMSPVEVLNEVKKIVEAKGFHEGTAIPGPNMQPWRDLASDYESVLRRDNPVLDAAMTKYAEAKSLPEFFDIGVNALGKQNAGTEGGIQRSVAGLSRELQGATPQQAAAERAGLINAGRMQAQEGTPGTLALAKRLQESAPLEAKVRMSVGDEAADRIMQQAKSESTFNATNQGIRGNSATSRRLANMADEGLENLQVKANPQGITTRMVESVGRFLKNIRAPNEATRDELGRLLLNPNGEQNQQLLEALAAALQARKTAVVPQAAIAGSAGAQTQRLLEQR